MLNIPENRRGKAEEYYSHLMIFWQWYYDEKVPDLHPGDDFKGHHFHDWEPDDSNPILLYRWGKKHCNKTEINRLILGLPKKEEEI